MKKYFENALQREIIELTHKEKGTFRVPALLGNRYEVSDILTAGGLGVILIAHDKKLLNKKVLIKRSLYAPILFENQNDGDRPNTIQRIRRTMNIEKAAMLHGWARRIPNIPILLDLVEDINPDIYGPHTDKNGRSYTTTPDIYGKEPYLILNYFTGAPVTANDKELSKNVFGFTHMYINTISEIIRRFHTPYTTADRQNSFQFYYTDLKPSNVLRTEEKQLVLIDMGSFAIKMNGKIINDIITTPGYRAPELISGQQHMVSAASDIYTLAVVAMELITRKQPIPDAYGGIELDWKLFENECRNGKYEHWLPIFRKATERNPAKRYQSMEEFKGALNGNSKKPTTLTYWQPQLEEISGKWKTNKFFLKQIRSQSTTFQNINVFEEHRFFTTSAQMTIFQNNNGHAQEKLLLESLYQSTLPNLVNNWSFMPELLEILDKNNLITYAPQTFSNLIDKRTLDKNIEKSKRAQYADKTLEKSLYFLMQLDNRKMQLLGITPTTLQNDTLGNMMLMEHWLLLPLKEKTLTENPLLPPLLGDHYFAPPELILQRSWHREKSWSWLAGVNLLMVLDTYTFLKTFQNNRRRLYEKAHYERYVRSLPLLSSQMKEILLNLLAPDPALRATPMETIQKIKNQKNTVIARGAGRQDSVIQIQYTENLRYYKLEIYEISNKVRNLSSFVTKHILLHYNTDGAFAHALNKPHTQVHITRYNEAGADATDLLKKSNARFAVLIWDYTIDKCANELQDALDKYEKVLLFAPSNPLNLPQLRYFDIFSYATKKGY